jgi:isoleucyl-tRNA synthetase
VTENATTYKYKVTQIDGQPVKEPLFLLAWSTTPWNKLATPALAVNANLTYLKVRQDNQNYILAESALGMLQPDLTYQVLEKIPGSELTNYQFELHYDFFPNRTASERVGVVIADDFVTATEGTGVVTLAVYGEDDYRVMQKEGVQLIEHVDEEGKLKPEVTAWAGMYILKVNPLVDEDLEKRGLVYAKAQHQHSVATCYRCSTRLYYAPLPAWFIDISKLRERMLALNQNVNWVPAHLKEGRFKKGLENAPDWNVSRSRYWGTPMPIWVADADEVADADAKHPNGTHRLTRVIGSIDELKKWAVDPQKVANLTDIHPEFLTDVEVYVDDQRKIKGKRISEVFDCWVESGSMPFASVHYPFENKEVFENSFPGQFVSEYIAQTRAWFYTMHVISTGIFDQAPFENVLTTGTIMAADGTKMSKSKKNYTDPMLLIEKYGVDSLRLYLMSSPVMKSENINFNEVEVAEIRKKVFLIWYNMVAFYKLYATGASDVSATTPDPSALDVMDAWLLSRLNNLIQTTTKHMDEYDVLRASRELMEFVDELSTWYLRRSRDRIRDDAQSQAIFGQALVKLAQLLAPFAPFFSEWVYQTLVDPAKSIHHTNYPVAEVSLINLELENSMLAIRKASEKTHSLRIESQIKVRQPLAKLTVKTKESQPSQELLTVLQDEVNVKEVVWQQDTDTDWEVVLDTTITDELKAEGEARELIRSIQKLRKTSGLTLAQTATVELPSWPAAFQDQIESKTNSKLQVGLELKLN